jgi:hypothetical protein
VVVAVEILRVLSVAARVEQARTNEGPTPLLTRLRVEGTGGLTRTPQQRRGLRRAVDLVDRFFPGGPNCYRRVLLEVALDAGAARDRVCLGLRAGGGSGTGHAYFAADGPGDAGEGPAATAVQSFDAIFEM